MSKTTQHLQDVSLLCGLTVGEYLAEIQWKNDYIQEEDEILERLADEHKEDTDG